MLRKYTLPYRVCRFTATTPFSYYFRCLVLSKRSFPLEEKGKKMDGRAAKCLAFVGTYRAFVHIENSTRPNIVACEVNGDGYSGAETNVYTGGKSTEPTRTREERSFFSSRKFTEPIVMWEIFCLRVFRDNERAGSSIVSPNLIFKEDLMQRRKWVKMHRKWQGNYSLVITSSAKF